MKNPLIKIVVSVWIIMLSVYGVMVIDNIIPRTHTVKGGITFRTGDMVNVTIPWEAKYVTHHNEMYDMYGANMDEQAITHINRELYNNISEHDLYDIIQDTQVVYNDMDTITIRKMNFNNVMYVPNNVLPTFTDVDGFELTKIGDLYFNAQISKQVNSLVEHRNAVDSAKLEIQEMEARVERLLKIQQELHEKQTKKYTDDK